MEEKSEIFEVLLHFKFTKGSFFLVCEKHQEFGGLNSVR
jgi:hypothetical protein